MRIVIDPSKASGTVAAPPSKSLLHRALICSFLAGGGTVRNAEMSEDVLATLDCIEALGGKYEITDDTITVCGSFSANAKNIVLPCRESGSTLRFLIPVILAMKCQATFTGMGNLLSRPLDFYEKYCAANGYTFAKNETGITVSGMLNPGYFEIPGDVSSQYVTGMLFGLSVLKGKSVVKLVPPFTSRPYIALTLGMLKRFGISAGFTDESTLEITGGTYTPCDLEIEGDWSNSAFLSCFNYLGGSVKVTGLCEESLQGDKIYTEYFERLRTGSPVIDISDTPDLGPVLFSLAGILNGATFTGTKRLRYKESDRIEAMRIELKKIGIEMETDDDEVTVHKSQLHTATETICGHNDHRIVMAMACVLTLVGGKIDHAEAVCKSFPNFFKKLTELGIKVTVTD